MRIFIPNNHIHNNRNEGVSPPPSEIKEDIKSRGSFQSKDWFDKVETTEEQWEILWAEKEMKIGCPAYLKSDISQMAWVKPRREQLRSVFQSFFS